MRSILTNDTKHTVPARSGANVLAVWNEYTDAQFAHPAVTTTTSTASGSCSTPRPGTSLSFPQAAVEDLFPSRPYGDTFPIGCNRRSRRNVRSSQSRTVYTAHDHHAAASSPHSRIALLPYVTSPRVSALHQGVERSHAFAARTKSSPAPSTSVPIARWTGPRSSSRKTSAGHGALGAQQ